MKEEVVELNVKDISYFSKHCKNLKKVILYYKVI